MNARWGMSPAEVEAANGLKLEPGTDDWLEATGQKFLGRQAVVRYTFKDGRLASYHIFVSDLDPEALEDDVTHYLERRFGSSFSSVEDDGSLKRVWQFRDKIVNYWFYEDGLAIYRPFKAAFGVVSLQE